MAGPRLLVVDDDEAVRTMLGRILSAEGFEVTQARDAASAHAALEQARPNLILLDVMLPAEDGRDVLAEIRKRDDVPVILVTALGQEHERILGLKLGADDYIVKPFSPGELVARIQSVLRRTQKVTAQSMQFGALEIDVAAREVRLDGEQVAMTAKEYDLLLFLASSPRQVFSRDQLLDHVWNSSPDWQDSATVTEHIRRLRRRIEADPNRPRWVQTVRGAGYRFEP